MLDQSGVWRYRELFPFLADDRQIVTLREGNTPLLPASANPPAEDGPDQPGNNFFAVSPIS